MTRSFQCQRCYMSAAYSCRYTSALTDANALNRTTTHPYPNFCIMDIVYAMSPMTKVMTGCLPIARNEWLSRGPWAPARGVKRNHVTLPLTRQFFLFWPFKAHFFGDLTPEIQDIPLTHPETFSGGAHKEGRFTGRRVRATPWHEFVSHCRLPFTRLLRTDFQPF